MDVTTATEAELLGAMAASVADPIEVRAAWGELYERHKSYLFAVLSRTYGGLLDSDAMCSLVTDSFVHAYRWSSKQPDREGLIQRFDCGEADATRMNVLAWLCRIAERAVKESFRRRASERMHIELELVPEPEEFEAEPEQAHFEGISPIIAALFRELTERERDVLRLSLPWYNPTTSAFDVPQGVAQELAALLGMSPGLFRKTRHRILKRLKQRFGDEENRDE